MNFRLLFKYLIIFLIPLNMIQPVKADLASDLLQLAGEVNAKNKAEYAKWGIKSSKDIKKLKTKEVQILFNGNVLEGIFNDNQNKGKTVEVYYKDGTYRGSVLGKSESAKWYVKEGKLCYKEFNSCAKVYKSKSEPIVYYLKQQGIIYTKFTKVGSIEEIERVKKAAKEKRIATEKAAKEKRISEEKLANEKKIAEEKIAKKKLEKKLLLLPSQTDLKKAQNFINIIKNFVKQNPDEFDIIKISELFIVIKPISDGTLDAKLEEDLELLKEFSTTSNAFTKHYKILEEMRVSKEVKKIDQTILSLEKNIKSIKNILVNNPESIYIEQWIDDLKKAKKILNNSTSHDELVKESNRISKVILNKQKIDKAKTDAKFTIDDLKENLRIDLTSDIAPLIIEQVKFLEQAIKEEDIKEIIAADKIAKEFIFKQFEEPKLKAAEEKRIAEEKVAKEKRIAEKKAAEEERIAAEKAYEKYKKTDEYKKNKKKEEKEKELAKYPTSYASYDKVQSDVGCTSTYSKQKKNDIWKKKYVDHWFEWTGVITITPEADEVALTVDFIPGTDLRVKFKDKNAGYNLIEYQPLTVKFLMTGRGGCFLPFKGSEGLITQQ